MSNEHRTAAKLHGKPFAPGFDPRRNHGGRPRRPAELVEALRAVEPEAVQTLARLMRNARGESVRLAAASAILDRLYGRPTQPVADESAGPLEIRVVYVDSGTVMKAEDVAALPPQSPKRPENEASHPSR